MRVLIWKTPIGIIKSIDAGRPGQRDQQVIRWRWVLGIHFTQQSQHKGVSNAKKALLEIIINSDR